MKDLGRDRHRWKDKTEVDVKERKHAFVDCVKTGSDDES
jgi:hypothetical protein